MRPRKYEGLQTMPLIRRSSFYYKILLVLAALLVPLLIHTYAKGAGQVLIGDQKIEVHDDSDSAGQAEAFKATAIASGQLSSLTVYVGSSSAATSLTAGIYTNSSTNHPATLLAQGTLSSPAKSSWDTVTLTSQPQITSGSIYWITVLSPHGAGTFAFRDASGGKSETSSSTSLSSLPTSWTTGKSYNDGPISAYGTAILAPDTTPPSAPTNLAASNQTTSSIGLSWTASTDNVGVAGYNLYLNGTKVSSVSSTSYSFTGLTCGTGYNLGVEAYDAAGNISTRSLLDASTAACPDTTPPSTPTNLTQSGSTTASVSFSWSASTDNVGVTGYDIYLNGGLSSSTGSTNGSIGNLTCGQTYTVAVDAFDAAGNHSSQTSAAMSTDVCPPDTTPPSAPTGLVVTSATTTSINLSWNAASDNVSVAGYDTYLNSVLTTTTTGLSYGYSGLTCATTYNLSVDAFDAAGNYSSQSVISASTAACPDTTPPLVNLTSPLDGSTVAGTITISANASDNVAIANVQFQLDGVNLGTPITSGSYQISWNTLSVTNGQHVLTAIATDTSGNTTVSSPITVTINNPTPSIPTPSPSVSQYGVLVGPGVVRSTSRQIIRTSQNNVYIFAVDDNVCQGGGSAVLRAYKGSGANASNNFVPTAFTEADSAHHPVSSGNTDCTYSGSSMLEAPDVRLDPSGIARLVYIDQHNGSVYYDTFSTITDSWGVPTLVANSGSTLSGAGWPRTSQSALTLDANNNVWIAYATSGTSNSIQVTNNTSGVFSPAVTIYSGTNEMHPSFVTSADGSLHLAWLDNSLATQSTILYDHYSGGAWSPVETVTAGDSNVLANGDDDQGPSIATDTQNRPHVLFMDGTVNGSNDDVRLRYRTAAGSWVDNTPPGGQGGASNPAGTMFAHTPGLYISSANDEYAFLGHDVNIQYGYQYQLGGPGNNWGAYTTLDPQSKTTPYPGDTCEPGTDGAASLRFDPLRETNSSIIDSAYYDEKDDSDCNHHHAQIFYKAFLLNTTTQPSAPADSTPPTVSLTSPTGSSVSGNVQLAANATDNAAVAAVQFQIDGVNLGAAITNTPYSMNWDSTTVSNGSHTITAIATDTSGNSASTSETISVSNTIVQTSSLLSQSKPATASSTSTSAGPPSYVTDGSLSTRWSSNYADPQWIYIDLGSTYNITEVALYWETAYGKAFQIQVSNDATTWTTIYSTTSGTGGTNDIQNLSGSGRYVRMYGTVRGTQWGYSLWEFKVYGY